jgi:hypothetical protein
MNIKVNVSLKVKCKFLGVVQIQDHENDEAKCCFVLFPLRELSPFSFLFTYQTYIKINVSLMLLSNTIIIIVSFHSIFYRF